MAVLTGRDASLAVSGIPWEVHRWRVRGARQVWVSTGDTAAVTEYSFGDKTLSGEMDVSMTDKTGGTTDVLAVMGTAIADVVFTTHSGRTFTSNITPTRQEWVANRERGGPRQVLRIFFVSDDNTSGSLLNAI